MKATIKTLFISLFIITIILNGKTKLIANDYKNITGTVIDASTNTPIQNVMVTIKNTNTNTFTNKKGSYNIKVQANSTLTFYHKNYVTYEERVGNKTNINIKLSPNYNNNKRTPSMDVKIETERSVSAYGISTSCIYSPPQDYYNNNTEEYDNHNENSFQIAENTPLSTFSIDVDAASYSNMRRFTNQGQIPPKDAIRTEELINYFNYNYPQPTGNHPVNIITELSECPWNAQNTLLHIGIKAKDIPVDKLPNSNFVFLIDVSGSMYSANRLPLVKSSMKMLVKQLRKNDKVAIVTYAGDAGVALESTNGNEKEKINEAIDKLNANGSTAGGAGIKLAYQIAKKNFIKGGNNRIILATDGDFNVGVSSNTDLEKLIEQERKIGVYLTVLGYGMGNYKDSKMQTLAQKGNGNHAYIDNLTEAKKVLVNEFARTLFTIAKDVKLQIEFNPQKVQAYRLIGYESRLLNKEDFNNDTKDAGEMGAGHTVTALYEIIPTGINSNLVGSVDDLKYQKKYQINENSNYGSELLTIKLRYKPTDSNTSNKIEIPVKNIKRTLLLTSINFRFSAAVAQIGMLLHDSPFKSNATYDNAIQLAKTAYGKDEEGYRHEFVKLAENLKLMTEMNNQ